MKIYAAKKKLTDFVGKLSYSFARINLYYLCWFQKSPAHRTLEGIYENFTA